MDLGKRLDHSLLISFTKARDIIDTQEAPQSHEKYTLKLKSNIFRLSTVLYLYSFLLPNICALPLPAQVGKFYPLIL